MFYKYNGSVCYALIINFEISPGDYFTKKYTLNPVEGSMLTPTKTNNYNGLSWVENED